MPRPIALPGAWKDLAEKLDGVGKLAKALGGVDPTTLRRWANGRMPNRAARVLIVGLFKKHGLKVPELGSAPDVGSQSQKDLAQRSNGGLVATEQKTGIRIIRGKRD